MRLALRALDCGFGFELGVLRDFGSIGVTLYLLVEGVEADVGMLA